jgi:protein phosphatase 4 regulatory subunit 3
MKAFILMNDSGVIEHMVDDDIVLGVVGALEYDPDFPTHKANHRQYLGDQTRYKEVVEIKDQHIKKKIRQTWRLQYLKDVVLARLLDDPTFGVLNSLIYFNQVEIVQHIQANAAFLKELFSVFDSTIDEPGRKEEAVHFLQQCAAIAKTLQIGAREALLTNFIQHGLFAVITFAVQHAQASLRTTGIDILVALLDHNPNMMRSYMIKAVREKQTTLTDILIDALHAETDLGVKNQLADAIKILLDPQPPTNEPMGNRNGSEFVTKLSRPPQLTPTQAANEQFAQDNFDRSCRKLFKPLKDLEHRESVVPDFQSMTLYSYLVEILTFFLRQHPMRSRHFVASENLTSRVAQLLQVPQKSLKLTALKFFRTGISLQDQFYSQQILRTSSFGPIIDIVIETMPRDNLLNSACLEMFEFIRKETIKPIIIHLGENYRQKLQSIIYVDSFESLLMRYDQLTADKPEIEHTLFSQDEDSPSANRQSLNGRWQGIPEMGPDEENYFDTSDDDDDLNGEDDAAWEKYKLKEMPNGSDSPANKPLVDYPDDEDDDSDELLMDPKPIVTPQTPLTPESESGNSPDGKGAGPVKQLQPSPEIKSNADAASELQNPPERMAEKRRRQEDEEEDELGKLSTGVKRRNSSSGSSASSLLSQGASLKRKKSFLRGKQTSLNNDGSVQAPKDAATGDDKPMTDGAVKKSPRIKVNLSAAAAKADGSKDCGKDGSVNDDTTK